VAKIIDTVNDVGDVDGVDFDFVKGRFFRSSQLIVAVVVIFLLFLLLRR
jgi:hypothetical protein